MANPTVLYSSIDTNSSAFQKWIIVNGKTRRVRGIRVPTGNPSPRNRMVFVKLGRDGQPRGRLANHNVFDTTEAAQASLTPIPGLVLRRRGVLDARLILSAEPIVRCGDGSYEPANRRGLWCGAFATRAAARTSLRAVRTKA